jgi:hypothetical protein
MEDNDIKIQIEKLAVTVRKIEDALNLLIASDRYTVQKALQLFDGRNIQTGLTTGTKFPAASGQKVGFWGVTPVDQPEVVTDPTISTVTTGGGNLTTNSTINSNFSALEIAIEAINDRLQEAGITKSA